MKLVFRLLGCVIFTAMVSFHDAASLQAAVAVYFGGPDSSKLVLGTGMSTVTPARNSFLATLSTWGAENVEGLSGTNPTLTFGATGITGTTTFGPSPYGVQTYLLLAVSGFKMIYDVDSTTISGGVDRITFSRPVTAFGTYITQGGDGPANTYQFLLENTVTGTSKTVSIATLGPSASYGNVVFAGVTDTQPFNRITFLESYDYDGLLYDDLIAGDLASPFAMNEHGNDLFGTSSVASAGAVAFFRVRRRKLTNGFEDQDSVLF
jgi:hypothetical protein